MEFGGSFDDDLFSETRERKTTPLLSYNAKRCEPYWFTRVDNSDDANIYKHCADLAMVNQDHQTALTNLNQAKELVPTSNQTVQRDIEESIARCHLGLGDHLKALTCAQAVFNNSVNYEQKTGALYLLCQVHKEMDQVEDYLYALHRQLILHSANPDLWHELGVAYSRLASKKSNKAAIEYVNGDGSTDCSHCAEDSEMRHTTSQGLGHSVVSTGMPHKLVVFTCLLRAKLAFRIVQNTVTSFAKTRNLKMQQELDEKIEDLYIPSDLFTRCQKWMHSEVFGLDGEDDGKSQPITDDAKVKCLDVPREKLSGDFEKKWFSWDQSEHWNKSVID